MHNNLLENEPSIPINIAEYINLVIHTDIDTEQEVVCNKSQTEVQAMLTLMESKLAKEREYRAWSIILDSILDALYKEARITFIPDRILSYLIDNNFDLLVLAHMRLEERWLKKIIQKDPSLWEAQKTIDLYKKQT